MDQITPKSEPNAAARERPRLPGQVVLVFQGGGALGAYQGGVYQALHEAGIEPDWIIGTSIGAINAGLIAGNEPQCRLERLHEFWRTGPDGHVREARPLQCQPQRSRRTVLRFLGGPTKP